MPRRASCAGAFLMDFLAGYPVLPTQQSILSRPHPLPALWPPTPSERNVANAPENIVRMERRKIMTHYSRRRKGPQGGLPRGCGAPRSRGSEGAKRAAEVPLGDDLFQVGRLAARNGTTESGAEDGFDSARGSHGAADGGGGWRGGQENTRPRCSRFGKFPNGRYSGLKTFSLIMRQFSGI